MTESTTSGQLSRDGFEIAWRSQGGTGEGTRAAGVFLHGFGTSSAVLEGLADALRARGALGQAVFVDLRGHGETRGPEADAPYTYPGMCDDVLAVIEARGLERPHLIGHSMGGQVALLAAIAAGERLGSLVAMGAGPCRAIEDPRERRSWERAASFFETAEPAALAAALADAAPTRLAGRPELAPERVYRDARGADLARVIRGGFFAIESNDAACRGVALPSLCLCGEHDETWLEPTRKLAGLIPGSELALVAEAGHLAHLEQPGAVAERIARFLADA